MPTSRKMPAADGTGRGQPVRGEANDQPGAAGRRRAWRLHLGRARPAARRGRPVLRRRGRDQRRRHERRGAGLRPGRRRRRGAQKALANFWRRVSHAAAFSPLQPSLLDRLTGIALARAFAGLHDVRHGDAADVALSVQSAELQSAAAACSSSRSISMRSAWRAARSS